MSEKHSHSAAAGARSSKSKKVILAAGGRNYLARFSFALLPSLLISSMLLVFSPYEVFFGNWFSFKFVFEDFALMFGVLSLAAAICTAALISVIRGKWFDRISALITGCTVAAYLQYMFMNLNLGVLDGISINWREYAGYSVLNSLVWLAIIMVFFTLLHYKKELFRRVVLYGCAALIAIQMIACVTLITSAEIAALSRSPETQTVLDGSGQYTVSSDENIIVIVLDTFSNTYYDKILAKYPNAFDALHDFTYYDNTESVYEGTMLAMPYLLTGQMLDNTVPLEESYNMAWSSENAANFYSLLASKGYKVNIYTDYPNYFGGTDNMFGKVSNVRKIAPLTVDVDRESLLEAMLKMSLYRFSPFALKQVFWLDTNEFDHIITTTSNEVAECDYKNYDFYQKLRENGLVADSSSKYFVFEHLYGLHAAYHNDENCNYAVTATLADAGMGCMRLVEEYLDQLKEIGVYDRSTIIVMSDHGVHESYIGAQPVLFVKRAGEKHEEMRRTSAPVSAADFIPTIVQAAGGDWSQFGRSFFDIGENEPRQRTLYIREFDPDFPSIPKCSGSGTSDYNVLYCYTYTGTMQDLIAIGKIGPTSILTLVDFWF